MDSSTVQAMQNPYRDLREDDLVSLCRVGDEGAFSELVRRYHSPLMKVALSITQDKQDAEDEVQNAFWKAYRYIDQFNRSAKFSTWLTRIVVNECLMRLRKVRRVKFAYLDETVLGQETLTLELKDSRPSQEQAIGNSQVALVLRTEIRRTPPLLRDVFMLRDVEHRPMSEVAEMLGISVAAAKSRLLRARAELRSRMRKHYGEIGPATLFA